MTCRGVSRGLCGVALRVSSSSFCALICDSTLSSSEERKLKKTCNFLRPHILHPRSPELMIRNQQIVQLYNKQTKRPCKSAGAFLCGIRLFSKCCLLSEDRREDTSHDICGCAYAEHYITECDHINSPFI